MGEVGMHGVDEKLEDVAVRIEKVLVFGAASGAQALRIAAASAVREAVSKAGGLVLQPIVAGARKLISYESPSGERES